MKQLFQTKLKIHMNLRAHMDGSIIIETLLIIDEICQFPALDEKIVVVISDVTT